MQTHFYSVVTCKAPACSVVGAVKYLGRQKRKIARNGGRDRSFLFECRVCHTLYRYEIADTRIESFGFAPPPGWENQF